MSGESHDALVREIIDAHTGVEGAALPILHKLQEAFGYVPDSALPIIAEALNISRAEIYGVVTFYHDFRREPAGRHVREALPRRGLPVGGRREVAERLRERLGVDFGETTPDGRVTLEAVYCLGLCACAPSAMVDGAVVGRLDDETARPDRRGGRADERYARLRARATPARSPSAPTTWRPTIERLAAEARRDGRRSCATARAASIGWSRWSRSRRRRAASPTARSRRDDVPGLFDAGFLEGKPHPLCLGPTEEIPFLKRQTRLTFARCGIVDPLSLDDYRAHGGYRGPRARA